MKTRVADDSTVSSTAAAPTPSHMEIDTSEEQDTGSLLRPQRNASRRAFLVPCIGGLFSGLAVGTALGSYMAVLLLVLTGMDLMPTIVYKMSVLLFLWIVGPLLMSASCVWCAARRRRRGATCGTRTVGLATGAAVLVSAFALSLPGEGQTSLILVLRLFVSTWPAPSYCAAAAAAQAARANASRHGRVWWHDYGVTAEAAAAALVKVMTRSERATLLNGEGYGPFGQLDGAYVGGTAALPRLWLPSMHLQDAAQGFRTSKSVIVGQVTSWPCLLGLAATWDPLLTRRFALALGAEFKAKGANVVLGPSLNVHRVARNGRNAEYMSGEEPLLGQVLVKEYVQGVQSHGLAACAKHFILNHQETNRMTTSAYASDRALFEVYYPPFEAAIEAGVVSFMCGYNRVNGTHACGNAHILNDHLRGALKFEGWVMSDWWALHEEAAAAAGVDQDMPGTDGFFDPPRLAALPESDALEARMATRILRSMLASGAYNNPLCTQGCDCERFFYGVNATSDAHAALARRIASSSAILLKNDDATLPIDATHTTVAIVGSACGATHSIDPDTADWTAGDYYVVGGSGRVVSNRAISITAALRRRGLSIRISASDDVDRALAAAVNADMVLACGGGKTWENEDRPTLRLDQHALLAGLSHARSSGQLQKPLAVAVLAPGQVAVSPWHQGADAVLAMFLAGQATGEAWADVLLGRINPSGKLPVTFPLNEEDMQAPCDGADSDHCIYDEGLAPSWRGLVHKAVGFAFGTGLSYSNFSYAWVAKPVYRPSTQDVTLSVTVTNTGRVAGAEVVQLYATYPPSAGEPPLVLRGFEKTPVLAPGSHHTAHLTLTPRALSTWQPGGGPASGGRWRIASGVFTLLVGSGSRDVRLEASLQVP